MALISVKAPASQVDYSALEFLRIRSQTVAAISLVLIQIVICRTAREKANVKNSPVLLGGTPC
jgi:hypothetical protein